MFSSKTTILTLLKLLKPIKTDRKSIVDSGSLDITSGSRLKWPFMPKQGPRSSTVQYCTVLYGNYHPSVQDDNFKTGMINNDHPRKNDHPASRRSLMLYIHAYPCIMDIVRL